MSASRRPAVIYVHFLEARELPIPGSERPAIIYARFLEASELAISASGRPAVIYVHFSEAKELAISAASRRPTIIYCPFFRGQRTSYIRFWEAYGYLCALLRGQ